MKAFDDYGNAVCAFVRHATAAEKEAIRKELADHMEDHAQALTGQGYPRDRAAQMALESMGDPKEVGQALNEEYPLRWLVLSRTALALLIPLWLAILLLLGSHLPTMAHNLQARYFPQSLTDLPGPYAAELRWDLPGDTVLSVYEVALTPLEDGTYSTLVQATQYSTHLLIPAGEASQHLTLSAGDQTSSSHYTPRPNSGVWIYPLTLTRGDTVTIRYDHAGVLREGVLTIPWEEVPNP